MCCLFVISSETLGSTGLRRRKGKEKERDLGKVLLISLRVCFHNCGLYNAACWLFMNEIQPPHTNQQDLTPASPNST